jgi:hypothetical protein
MTITQYAQDLRNRVIIERRHCRVRPLILVTYNLGGIIVKDVIIQSLEMQYQPDMLDLAKSGRHIFFCSTLYLGAAGIAFWGDVLARVVGSVPGTISTYGEVLRGLSPNTETRKFSALLNESSLTEDKIHI